MASDNRASFFRIGLTVFMGAVAIIATLIYIGGLRGRGDAILVETFYDKPVSGLAVGSAVNFRGVRIGEVREVGFIGSKYDVTGIDNSRIYILMALNKKLIGASSDTDKDEVEEWLGKMIDAGLMAVVSVNSITGIAKIECEYYPDEIRLLNLQWKPKHLLIPPKASLLENFSESATKVMNQINKMDLNAFWSNINASVESISAMTLSSQHLIESYQPELERMVKNLEEASEAVKAFAEDIRRDPSALLRGRDLQPLPETER